MYFADTPHKNCYDDIKIGGEFLQIFKFEQYFIMCYEILKKLVYVCDVKLNFLDY